MSCLAIYGAQLADKWGGVVKEFVDDWAPLAAILGFIAQAAMLVILGFGLKQVGIGLEQVRLAKQSLSVTNERASKEQALAFHERFLSKVMPEVVSARQQLQKAKETVTYEGPVGDFTFGSLTAEALEAARKRYQPSVGAINELEYYAVAFTSGVADEEVGFLLTGRLYCAYVASLYDLICVLRNDPAYATWQPIVDLYKLWSSRLTKAELQAQRLKTEAELAALGTAGEPRKPIGV